MRAAKSTRVSDKNNFAVTTFVFFKMSDGSEHSDSEFYYPGELSDAELLQSHSLRKHRKKVNTPHKYRS